MCVWGGGGGRKKYKIWLMIVFGDQLSVGKVEDLYFENQLLNATIFLHSVRNAVMLLFLDRIQKA